MFSTVESSLRKEGSDVRGEKDEERSKNEVELPKYLLLWITPTVGTWFKPTKPPKSRDPLEGSMMASVCWAADGRSMNKEDDGQPMMLLVL